VFSFKLKKGNPKTVFDNPGAIVLTESAATKLFGDVEPLDKTITVEGNPDFQTGVVAGIVEDPPVNSHLHFEALVSIKTKENSLSNRRRNFKNNPGHYAQSYVYLLLKEGTNPSNVETSLASLVAEHNAQRAPITLSLQPMSEFVTKDAGLQPGPTFSKTKINMMIGLSVVVLLSACFNYTNLSLVRALRRSKEISVRKITGATRWQIFSQFMTEAMILSAMALIVGTGIFFLIKPAYLDLSSLTGGEMFSLAIAPVHFFYLLLFTITVGIIAGFFPALFLSKLKASTLFSDATKIKLFSGVNARHVLITCQVALCIGLIMCAVIVRKQYNYALNYDLGYNTKNIVNIKLKGSYGETLRNEYSKIGEVVETSMSSVTLGIRTGNPAEAMTADRSDTLMFSCSYVDSKYLDMHGFELIAGTGFPEHSDENGSPVVIIVNERFLKELNLGTPLEAIGKEVWYFEDMKVKIQGVVKDFVSMSLDAESPTAFGFLNQESDERSILGVKISGNDWLTTMGKLENVYKKIDPVHPFEATFYEDQIAKTYEKSKTMYTIISFLAFLAISISTLGLLGLAVFTIETRMKEICIRKVLGAGIRNLALVLSRSYLIMIAVAAVLAVPGTFYIIDNVILSEFLYRVDIGLTEALSGLIVVFLIVIAAVGWQVRTAAIQNPADLLRDE
jgi:ABC-type antimicrobial peptide transport system permease subunit